MVQTLVCRVLLYQYYFFLLLVHHNVISRVPRKNLDSTSSSESIQMHATFTRTKLKKRILGEERQSIWLRIGCMRVRSLQKRCPPRLHAPSERPTSDDAQFIAKLHHYFIPS